MIDHVFSKYSISECLIIDQDSVFMSTLITYLFTKLDIKIKMVAPYSHQSFQAEHEIKSVTTIFMKCLTGLGQYWPKYLLFARYSYNTFHKPNLNGFSPYELVFAIKPKLLIDLESHSSVKVSGNLKESYK